MLSIMWIFRKRNPHKVFRGFRMSQTVSASALALGHGLQDAQKTMGVIFLALVASGYASPDDDLPLWVIICAASAISLGTYSGGWRIMRTLGRRIIHLDPARGFAAESVGAAVLYTTAFVYHAPISTTHTITSAVMGAGATKRFSAVRWGVARSIVTAWVLTFPMAGLSPPRSTWSSTRSWAADLALPLHLIGLHHPASHGREPGPMRIHHRRRRRVSHGRSGGRTGEMTATTSVTIPTTGTQPTR